MENTNIALSFIIGAIICLLLIAGILFLIIYGILKKKKPFWITGIVIAVIWLCLFILTFLGRHNEGTKIEQDTREQLNSR
ncbi:MAG: hypothetical protein V4677_15745 [Bacteroidota bacterium]